MCIFSPQVKETLGARRRRNHSSLQSTAHSHCSSSCMESDPFSHSAGKHHVLTLGASIQQGAAAPLPLMMLALQDEGKGHPDTQIFYHVHVLPLHTHMTHNRDTTSIRTFSIQVMQTTGIILPDSCQHLQCVILLSICRIIFQMLSD